MDLRKKIKLFSKWTGCPSEFYGLADCLRRMVSRIQRAGEQATMSVSTSLINKLSLNQKEGFEVKDFLYDDVGKGLLI
jgi:hypothetical protein